MVSEERQWVDEIKEQCQPYIAIFDKVVTLNSIQNKYTAEQLKTEYKISSVIVVIMSLLLTFDNCLGGAFY
ncbi:hypothetical protein BC351_20940 [Paenibacillus ferrarius]|uniref:Uncharacterized protein n=1 Tax=Paenibacillus ferrarius TaxID=1469647 RepID=A0A1V4HNM8_9BACL|nr:hypothetical protein BC351_20940 [Paenibacillus ferrarius]